MGKTAFALNIALNAAMKEQIPVAVFSLEMSKEQLAFRLLSSEAKVDAQRLRKGFLGETDWPKLTTAAGRSPKRHFSLTIPRPLPFWR